VWIGTGNTLVTYLLCTDTPIPPRMGPTYTYGYTPSKDKVPQLQSLTPLDTAHPALATSASTAAVQTALVARLERGEALVAFDAHRLLGCACFFLCVCMVVYRMGPLNVLERPWGVVSMRVARLDALCTPQGCTWRV
jgi:hypothetical protein